MNNTEFKEVLDRMLDRSRDVLAGKAIEYASVKDRLHNFKQAAALEQITPIQALGGMMAKHTISVYDMIESGKFYPDALWDEKITDHINYLILLRALAAEARPPEA